MCSKRFNILTSPNTEGPFLKMYGEMFKILLSTRPIVNSITQLTRLTV